MEMTLVVGASFTPQGGGRSARPLITSVTENPSFETLNSLLKLDKLNLELLED